MRYAIVALAALTPSLALPQSQAARRVSVQVLESRAIPRDVADNVSLVFNAAATLRLTGTQTVDAGKDIPEDVGIIDGALEIRGRVSGRVVAINSDVVVYPSARLERDVTILGGRFDPREGAQIVGDVRVYRDHLRVDYEEDRILVREEVDDQPWYRARRRSGGWGSLRLLSAKTYNRVEGLPVLIGPSFGRELAWGRVTVDVLGIIRSVDSFEWNSENVGHSVKGEVSVGRRGGIRFGARLFDIVEPVEPWHLSDSEVGLASFFLHRDYRDYYARHGGSLYSALFLGTSTDLTVAYSQQRWGARETRDPYTLFRDTQTWRENPQMDVGTFHVVNSTFRYDTRNDENDPWSGWFVVADLEHGTGNTLVAGPTSELARPRGVTGVVHYQRALIDVRRYNRLSPDAQLNVRLVAGGWLNGDELPLQRRFSVGGPGTLPGYDFRRQLSGTDAFTCFQPSPQAEFAAVLSVPEPAGRPAECERVALAQVEYRGALRIDPFGILGEERDRRRRGWGRLAEWVLFADAGRGWLVGQRVGELQYEKDHLPPLGTFRADVGVGVRLDDVGLYLAKAVTDRHTAVNFFLRLRPRF